jgi:uncharacterized cupredoxin-like copper-binding protein
MQDQDMPHRQAGTAMDHHATFSFGVPGKPAAVDRTIRIKALDMSFDPPAVEVRPDETVRFVVTNVSAVDHDFTLGDSKTQQEHRKEMAAMTDMAAAHAHKDPNAVFLEGRATKELVWRFGKPGQIEFGCNVPGHYEAGMKGNHHDQMTVGAAKKVGATGPPPRHPPQLEEIGHVVEHHRQSCARSPPSS